MAAMIGADDYQLLGIWLFDLYVVHRGHMWFFFFSRLVILPSTAIEEPCGEREIPN